MTTQLKAIEVERVSKKFCRSLRHSMMYGVRDVARNMIGLGTRSERLRPNEFWALDDVSFQLRQGESLGIIGQNGSGKSTLLKLLNGIMMPDKGRIVVRGRTAALIELGAGFHPMLSGRENVYVNGTILGMTRREIDEKFGAIVDFADIGDFLDSPVKYYSSGMFARLGFAVAAHVDPDVLLVDEVLAVGDADFRSKSYDRMLAFKDQGTAVCLVSHDMMSIQAIADSVIWLDHGQVKMTGTPEEVIPEYYRHEDRRGLARGGVRLSLEDETKELDITGLETLDGDGKPAEEYGLGRPLVVRLHFETHGDVTEPFVILAVRGPGGGNLFGLNMATDGGYPETLNGKGCLDVRFDDLPLYPGLYSIIVQVRKNPGVNYFSPRVMGHFVVAAASDEYGHTGRYSETYIHGGGVPSMVVPYSVDWKMESGVCRVADEK